MLMTRFRFALLSLLMVLLTVPWFYTTSDGATVLGFPSWGLYAVVTAALYAAFVTWALGRYWALMAGEADEHDG
ncbi:MAG: hypothetical protein RhofKO_23820 [Rhodothermales bacterium]